MRVRARVCAPLLVPLLLLLFKAASTHALSQSREYYLSLSLSLSLFLRPSTRQQPSRTSVLGMKVG